MANSFGTILKLTSFGESHGPAVGGTIEGLPAGLELRLDKVQAWLERRKPGQSSITTPRKESDRLEILSGLQSYSGGGSYTSHTNGGPLSFLVRNQDTRSKDYDFTQKIWRPSHADFTYEKKYGQPIASGGGRASARETIARVVAGAIGKQLLQNTCSQKIQSSAYVCAVGKTSLKEEHHQKLSDQTLPWFDQEKIEASLVRCPCPETSAAMVQAITQAKEGGDSLGGQILVRFRGLPAGLGEPVFDKVEALLAQAMLSLPAVKGFEIGSGFAGTKLTGSEHNDPIQSFKAGEATFSSNHAGGIQGGITSGNELYFFVAFKPTSTISKNQTTVDKDGQQTRLAAKGRHDPCVVPRAVAVCEAAAWHILADLYLRQQLQIHAR